MPEQPEVHRPSLDLETISGQDLRTRSQVIMADLGADAELCGGQVEENFVATAECHEFLVPGVD